MNNVNILRFPPQTVSDAKKKDKKWQRENLDAAEHLLMFDNSVLRQSFYNKQINMNLRRNILNERDLEQTLNPHQLEISKFPAKIQHIGLGNSKLDLLIGEEKRRTDRYDYRAFISSADQEGISSKEEGIKNMYTSLLQEKIQNSDLSDEQMELELKKLEKYAKYEYQDIREMVANKILKYEYVRKEVRDRFLVCFEDLLITGEEIMCIEELGNDISIRRVDPRRFFTLQSPDSFRVEDSDVMVEFTYMSPGQIIDNYYDVLSQDDVKDLETGASGQNLNYGGVRQMLNRDITIDERYGLMQGELQLMNNNAAYYFGSPYDRTGNVRVMKACWRSRRKVGKVPFIDDDGLEQFELIDESIASDLPKDTKVEWMYINEWWEGTKIGSELYVKIRPIPYQGRSKANLSESSPPYVGVYASAGGNNRSFSLMDKLKPLDYLYDIYSYRRELAMAAYHGPILAFNASMIPSDWDAKSWMYYVTTMKLMPLDPTNEILKGPSQGKSAGAFNTLTAQAINLEMGNFIQQHTVMMEQIKRDMDIVSGVNDYRQGQIGQDSAVGTAEMAYTASNSMTEKIFHLHSAFKRRVMRRILEVAKYVWKNNPQKAQLVLDDMGMEIVTTYDEFFESEYDIHVANSSADEELMQALKQLAHAAMQNGQASFKQIIEIYRTDSIASVARKLEEAEDEAIRRAQEAQQAEQQHEQDMQQAILQDKQADREFEMMRLDREDMNKQLDRENKLELEIIRAMGFSEETDIDANGIPDVLEQGKLMLDQSKAEHDAIIKERDLKLKEHTERSKRKIEERKIKLEEMRLRADTKAQDAQIRQTKVQNESQEKIAALNAKVKMADIAAKKQIAKSRPKPKAK